MAPTPSAALFFKKSLRLTSIFFLAISCSLELKSMFAAKLLNTMEPNG